MNFINLFSWFIHIIFQFSKKKLLKISLIYSLKIFLNSLPFCNFIVVKSFYFSFQNNKRIINSVKPGILRPEENQQKSRLASKIPLKLKFVHFVGFASISLIFSQTFKYLRWILQEKSGKHEKCCFWENWKMSLFFNWVQLFITATLKRNFIKTRPHRV